MALHAKGRLSEEALEVYRICSPLDAQDPAPLLLERGLSALPFSQTTAARRVACLLAAAESYLSHLPGPGVTDTRHGLARAVPATEPAPTPPNPVVESCLDGALRSLAETRPGLATAIAAASPYLDWITYDGYPAADIGAAFASGHAFASLVGEGAPYAAGDFDFGLFLVAPQILYRDHAHAAPELYAPLTGPHGWRFAPGAALTIKPAHEPVWNEPHQPHLTKVGAVPFLCFYGWTQNARSPARVVPAEDWAELEAMRL